MKRKVSILSTLGILLMLLLSSVPVYAADASTVNVAEDRGTLMLNSYSLSTDGLSQGEEFDLTLTFYNPSNTKSVRSIVVTLPSDESTFMPVYGETNQIYISEVRPGKTKEVTITLKAGTAISADYVGFHINLQYANAGGTATNNIAVLLPVAQKGFDEKARVLLDSYQISNDGIVPGKEFDLTMTLYNPSKEKTVDSILVTIPNDESTFMPLYGDSDQFFIDSIYAGEKKEVSLTLRAGEKISAKYIRFSVTMNFGDVDGGGTNTFTMQIPVSQTSIVQIENSVFPDGAYAGSSSRFQVKYKNVGVEDLYNVKMFIENKETQVTEQISLGSISGSKVGYAEQYLAFTDEGESDLNIWFTYENVDGEKYTSDITTYTELVEARSEKSVDISDIINEAEMHQNDGLFIEIAIAMILISGIVSLVLFSKVRKGKG